MSFTKIHRRTGLRAARAALFLLACALGSRVPTAAQSMGVIAGRVTDAATGAPLVGADLTLEGTVHTTATDRTGAFRLSGIPSGTYTLIILYLGHRDERAEVTVATGQTLSIDVKLTPAAYSEAVQVRGEPIGEGQARALNQQRTAPNITNVVSSDQIGSFPIRTRQKRRHAFRACRSHAIRERVDTCSFAARRHASTP